MEKENKKEKGRKKEENKKGIKGQQEVFGFVVIVIVIIVIGIILLSFGLRKGLSEVQFREDTRIKDLLHSILEYTTQCRYKKMKEVIVMCNNDEKCDGNSRACDIVKEEIGKILNVSLGSSEERLQYSFLRGYHFIVGNGDKINITQGNLDGTLMIMSSSLINIPPPNPGTLDIKLYLYFGKAE